MVKIIVSGLEIAMLICFGAGWPASIYKSWTARTTGSKSLFFLCIVIVGYICGIAKCLLADTHPAVLAVYCIDITMVSIDTLLYFRNAKLDREREALSEKS